jgi:hypothetical protein
MTARNARWLLMLVLTAALAGCAAIDRLSGEGEARRIRRVGQAAEARVIAIEDTGITLNDDPIVAFHLEVRPAAGAAYEVRTRGRVGRLDVPRVQPGAIVPVSVDPADPQKVAIRLYRDR